MEKSTPLPEGIITSNPTSPLATPTPTPPPTATAHSTFPPRQKRLIILLIASSAIFSPLSGFIYFPAISSLSRDLHVSIELINLTVTSYMIVAGIAPAIMGDLADMTGRRWVYILTLGIYCAANVGLATQGSFAALVCLRMMQSLGSAATIALAYGVISDISTPAERGAMVGLVIAGPNAAPSLGPVIGGALAQHAGWRWIFWLLVIMSAFCLIAIALFLPETSRHIVGDGSVETQWYHKSGIELLSLRLKSKSASNSKSRSTTSPKEDENPNTTSNSNSRESAKQRLKSERKRNCHIPNPISCLKLLFHREMAAIVACHAMFYMTYSCIQASMSSIFIDVYGLSELQAGLIYLPFGVGCAIASYLSGRFMNIDYKITARENNITIDRIVGDDMATFPIEKARLRRIWILAPVTSACIAGYGWSLRVHTSIAVPLVLQFIIGSLISIIFNYTATLVTDIHPQSPASAQAAINIVKCACAAGGLAVMQIIIDKLGVGWCFTIFAGIVMGTLVPGGMVLKWGMGWRNRCRDVVGGVDEVGTGDQVEIKEG